VIVTGTGEVLAFSGSTATARWTIHACRPRRLELDPGVDPIAGILQGPPDGDPKPFTGWL
jgi:hypothetical protein